MTKEEYELIKLSDLNREDNIKYISSEAQGIAIALDSDRYAPTLCKLERAYICGRRKSEKQIEELEQENRDLRDNYDQFKAIAEPEIERLKKENAELKSNRDYWQESSIYWHKQLKNKKYRRIAKAMQQQLAQAKEIIKDLLKLPFANNEEVYADVTSHLDRAEQFLKEIEK